MATSSIRKHPLLLGLALSLLLAAAASLAILTLARQEEDLGRRHWQGSLDRLADAKARAIHDWLQGQLAVLAGLKDNPSLQFYAQRLLAAAPAGETEAAESTFIRNLILATAERHGFAVPAAGGEIKANLAPTGDNGLGVFSPDLRPLAVTPGFAYPLAGLAAKAAEVLASRQGLILDVIEVEGRAVIGFLMPLTAMHTAPAATSATGVGVILGYKNLDANLSPLLRSTGSEAEDAWLLRRDGELITYLATADQARPAGRQTPATGQGAAAYAFAHPGLFAEGPDQAGRDLLFTSRPLRPTPLLLVQPVEAEAALRDYRLRGRYVALTLSLAACLIAACLAVAWRHGASVKERAYAEELRRQTELLADKSRLLAAITGNVSDLILLVGAGDRCLYANPALAVSLDSEAEALIDKGLGSIFGLVPAGLLASAIRRAQDEGRTEAATLILELGNRLRQFHAIFTPIGPAETLVTLHDLTELIAAQERQSQLFRQLIATMMRAVDLHDPYSANHSAKTAGLAVAMGRAMGLAEEELSTLETAANLCNLGKLSIPREILTKQEGLTEAELSQIHQEPHYASTLLKDLDFPGPLQQTLLQKHEFLDGSGQPNHLQGESILVTARVLAVATAFVAMISPRAYRDRLERAAALAQLLAAADRKYERKAVAALFQVVENEPGWWREAD